ncbi:ATP-dependent nuclease [Streptomyces montanisoli]|uniref:AAA family ATPase n=1 Tax=Streptomyces montanisoli TaxID=2798581 RepID=A0A940M9W5_9ACTN|nr:AAA family ATPase [Streptomyces montanisoli]MBP0458985.1 AAA family ATPase [Streptomyces montanisoli]
MRISRISWENYRRLPDGGIPVRRHLVLIGPNDSGKSSVLRAVHLCLGATRAQLYAALQVRDFTDLTRPLRLQVDLCDLDNEDRAAFPDEVMFGDTAETIRIVVVATLNVPEGADPAAAAETMDARRYFDGAGHDRGPTRDQVDALGWAYVPAARSMNRELGGTGGTMQSLLDGLDLGADADTVAEAATRLREAVQEACTVKDFGVELAHTLSQALPQQVHPDDIHLTPASDLGGSPLAGMTVTVQDGEHPARLTEQSDGVRALSLLALLGMTQRTARIVGMDEPEIHLHTTAQRAIARTFRDSPGQRLIVSHSASLVGQMNPLDIVAFGADRAPRQLPEANVISGKVQAAKFWLPNMIDALTARKILFVEGASDRLFIERFADLIGLDLDRRGIAIVELGGCQMFPSVYRLLGPEGFAVPLYGITDEDARKDWAEAVGAAPEDLESYGYFVCQPDLEGLYTTALGRDRMLKIIGDDSALPVKSLLNLNKVTSLADITLEHVAHFCSKRKLPAAIASADALTEADTASLSDLCHFLRMVAA